ncbi:MAG: hypothetical protein RIS83_833, partial [Pseudomonadota bacterium]
DRDTEIRRQQRQEWIEHTNPAPGGEGSQGEERQDGKVGFQAPGQ